MKPFQLFYNFCFIGYCAASSVWCSKSIGRTIYDGEPTRRSMSAGCRIEQRRPGIAPLDPPLPRVRLVFLFFLLPAFPLSSSAWFQRLALTWEGYSSECSGCCEFLISSGKFELLRIGLISLGGFTHFMLRVELLPPIRRFSLHDTMFSLECFR